ncbi:hypothetical protein HLASA_3014 (plasmid) [Halanaeroarchaeum sulfurireducens]|uniref:Uncharacterized protein n=1 Tax=Halanaeroarchaeum sulfurireducens TaxID=1604004 RepID=A0A0N9MM52_9EURY|nr:hypothetical protein HLASA_3014 [Halanaeroarchaeum sulfurireducens]
MIYRETSEFSNVLDLSANPFIAKHGYSVNDGNGKHGVQDKICHGDTWKWLSPGTWQ